MEETGPEAGGNMTCPRYKQHETQSAHGGDPTLSPTNGKGYCLYVLSQ